MAMNKKEAIVHWANLEPNQNPLDHMIPIPNTATGSTLGTCGIRIDGPPEFIDAVLSCLKPVLLGESNKTRISCSRTDIVDVKIKGVTKSFVNKCKNAEYCLIRLYERGDDAKGINTAFNLYGG